MLPLLLSLLGVPVGDPKAWCKNFSEFTGNSDGGLDDEKFLLAVQNTLPGRAAAAQLQALYKGH